MKSYTDLPQSQRLAKILSHESADMVYVHTIDLEGDEHYDIDFRNNQPLFEDDICAWSLAALLGALEHPRCFQGDKPTYWFCGCLGKDKLYHEVEADNPIDACYEMILKLHEQNLI